jgi:dihydrofolate reductase
MKIAKSSKRNDQNNLTEVPAITSRCRTLYGSDKKCGYSHVWIVTFMKLNLFDEYQFSVQPIIVGKGLPLFRDINNKILLKLVNTKTFGCGAVTFYYEPTP